MDTPSDKLACKIVERLVRENLVTEQEGKKILPKLAQGKLLAEDWQLAIELSAAKEGKQ